METVTLARVGAIPNGDGRAFEVGDVVVGVFNCDGRYFAVDKVCTHARALLHEGSIDRVRCTVECPLHSAEFDLATGEALTPPASEPVTVFAVTVQDGGIRIELPG